MKEAEPDGHAEADLFGPGESQGEGSHFPESECGGIVGDDDCVTDQELRRLMEQLASIDWSEVDKRYLDAPFEPEEPPDKPSQ